MFDKSTRRRRLGLVSIATLGAAASLTLLPFTSALADVTTGLDLDGVVLADSATGTPDWGATTASSPNSIFTVDANGAGMPRTPLPTNFLSAGFIRDFIPGSTADNSTYTNGSKDINNISTGWACVSSNNVTDKGDIQNGYAAAYIDPVTGDLVLHFGMEKNSSNGDKQHGRLVPARPDRVLQQHQRRRSSGVHR